MKPAGKPLALATALRSRANSAAARRSDDGDAAPSAAAPLVSYSLRRLTRGLGSGREVRPRRAAAGRAARTDSSRRRRRQGARQGFALAFAGALSVLPSVSTKAAMDILQSYSEPVTGSAKVRAKRTRRLRACGVSR